VLIVRTLLAMFALALLAGCETTEGPSPDVGISIPGPPPSLSAPCAAPVTLPTVDTDQQDTERLWAADRTSLKICADRQTALVRGWTGMQQAYGAARPKTKSPPATGAGAR
jgi:hypothetical protein